MSSCHPPTERRGNGRKQGEVVKKHPAIKQKLEGVLRRVQIKGHKEGLTELESREV